MFVLKLSQGDGDNLCICTFGMRAYESVRVWMFRRERQKEKDVFGNNIHVLLLGKNEVVVVSLLLLLFLQMLLFDSELL